jgi:hypothetical protein
MLHLLITYLQLFHKLLTTSISRATYYYKSIHAWAKLYNINVGVKYDEVETMLYSDDGLFSRGDKNDNVVDDNCDHDDDDDDYNNDNNNNDDDDDDGIIILIHIIPRLYLIM